jgi:hypothetical protein
LRQPLRVPAEDVGDLVSGEVFASLAGPSLDWPGIALRGDEGAIHSGLRRR